MLKFDDKIYYLDLKQLSSKDNNIDVIMELISFLTPVAFIETIGNDDEDEGDSWKNNNDEKNNKENLEDNDFLFKLAYNTLKEYNILKIKEE